MERYHALQGADAALVEILAVSYDSLTASQMAKCLNRLGKRNEKGRPFSTQDVDLLKEKPELAVLLKRMHRFLLSPEFLEPIAQHLVLEGNFERIASVVQSSVPARATNSTFAYFQFRCFEQAMRDYRVLLYTRRWDEAKQFLNACSKLPTRQQETRNVLEEFVFGLPDLDFFAKAPRQWLDEALSLRLYRALERLYLPEPWQKTVRVRLSQEEAPPDLRLAWATLLLWMGEMEEAVQEANRLCSDPQFVHQAANLRACAFLAMGKIEESLESFEETLALRTKATRKRKVFHEDAPGVFHLLTLLAQKGAAANKRIEALLPALSKLGGSDRGMLEEALDQYLDPNAFPPVDASVLRGRLLLDLGLSPEVVQQFQHRLDWPAPSGGSFPEDPFCLLSVVITRACSERSFGLFEIEYLTELYKDLKDSGMLWLAGEIEAALHLPQETSKKEGEQGGPDSGCVECTRHRKPDWPAGSSGTTTAAPGTLVRQRLRSGEGEAPRLEAHPLRRAAR